MVNKKFLAVFFPVLGVAAGMFFIFKPAILFFIILSLVICGLIYFRSAPKERKFLLSIFILALLSRVILSFIYYEASLASGHGVDYFGDAVNYSNNALYITEVITRKDISKHLNEDHYLAENVQIARGMFNNHLPPFYEYQIGPYSYYIAYLYTIFGYEPFLVKLLNCLFASLLCLAVFSMAKELFTLKAGKIAMVITAFFPSLFFWSITSLRDTMLILAITALFWVSMRFQNKPKILYALLFVLLLVIIGNFKRNIIGLLALSVGIPFFIYKLKFAGKLIVIAILMLMSFQVIFNPASRLSKFAYKQFQELRPETLIKQQVVNTYLARSGYLIYPERFYRRFIYSLPDEDIENVRPGEYLFGMALGIGYFLFSPFPWHMPTISELITYPQMIIWYFLIACSIAGFLVGLRYKRSKALGIIIFSVLMIVLNSLVEGNKGTMFRHRDMLTPFILIFASAGICRLSGSGLKEDGK